MITADVYCDCHHRQSVHHVHRVRDGHGELGLFRAACGLLGCSCEHFTQSAQRAKVLQDAATDRLMDDLGGVSASW